MRKRFKLPLGLIVCLITVCSLFFVSYFILYHESYAMNVVVDYPLSINYNTSEVIDDNNYESVVFSVINNGDEELVYSIAFEDLYSSENLSYSLVIDDTTITGVFASGNIQSGIVIDSGEMQTYEITISANKDTDFSAKLNIYKDTSLELNFSESILSNNEVNKESETKIVSEAATTDEGLILLSDDSGDTYYFRGNVLNNYVSFADLTWRIVKINTNGTVKLILDSEVDTLTNYYSDNLKYDFENSDIIETLNYFYSSKLSSYDNYIASYKYCNDNSLVDSTNHVFAAYNRVVNDSVATYYCTGDEVTSKIGLITIDEVMYAGASNSGSNADFYLINDSLGNYFYTMSGADFSDDYYYPFTISSSGEISYSVKGTEYIALRPVINILKDVLVTGTGTIDDPYIMSNY